MDRRNFMLAGVLWLLTLPSRAGSKGPKRVPSSQAASHVGEVITVIGKVAEVSRANLGGHIYLNFGAPYPRQEFAVVIFKNEVKRFPQIDKLKGRTIEVTGKVRLQQGQRRIQLVSPKQLVVR